MYSIGDEQGPGYARAAAWSPLGISEFRRYVRSSLFLFALLVHALEFVRGISLLVNIDQVREKKKVYFGYPHDKSPGQDFCPWVGPLE